MNETDVVWQEVQWSYSGLKNYETWRPVVDYEGYYEVSSFGRMRSVTRTHTVMSRWGHTIQRTRVGRMMPTWEDPLGYAQARVCKNGRSKTMRLSRVILAAFVRPPRLGEEAGHLDDNPRNNKVRNLAWLTRQENEDHKTQRGRRPASTVGKFDMRSATLVRDIRAHGFTLQEIAALFQCHYTNIGYICKNVTWQI